MVNDNSRDDTERVLVKLCAAYPEVRYISNMPPNRYGFAVRSGLADFRGDAVAVFMADGSDDAADLVRFYRKFQEGYDCVFGSRFIRGGSTIHYPVHKLILNRMGNALIQALFLIRYNDVTNAFKLYSRTAIAGIQPLLSSDFNLDRRAAVEVHRARLSLRGGVEFLAQSQRRYLQVQDSGNGISLSLHHFVLFVGKDVGRR